MNQNTFCKYCHRIPSQCGCTHPVEKQDESFDRTASHMAGEYVSYKPELTDEEINEVIRIEASKDPAGIGWNLAFNVARAILRKASE